MQDVDAPRQRAVFYTARYTPKILPTVLRAGIAQLDRGDADDFMVAMHREGTRDLALIRDMGLEPLLQSGYREAVEQGHRGFADEALFMVRDWSHRITGPCAPAVFLNGDEDPVIDPDDMRRTLQHRPCTRVDILPDAAQLILFDQPGRVLDEVEALFA